MSEQLRYFQVSGRGNGIGVTVLRRNPDVVTVGPTTLTLHIFPKFWSDYFDKKAKWANDKEKEQKVEDYKLVRKLPGSFNTEAKNWHTYLYEMDILALSEDWAKCLGLVANKTSDKNIDSDGLQLTDEDIEIGEKDPLWKEIIDPSADEFDELLELEKTEANFMWELLAEHGMEPQVVPKHKELPPTSMDLLPDVPALQEVFYTQFTYAVKEAIRHRKPVFLPVQEELGFVRGRMVPQGLVDRKVRGRLPVLCEYDALTTDSYVWQVIRAATQAVATSKNEVTVESAIEIDAQIRDISLISVSTLLTNRASSSDLGRMQPSLKTAYLLGRAILNHQFGAGTEEPVSEAGVIANIKYTSSKLWEKIVADYLLQDSQGCTVQEQQELYTFYEKPDGQSIGHPKTPDIVATRKTDNKVVVLDAKYKFAKNNISQATMGDQYQLMTYSYRMDCDAFLAYPTSGEASIPEAYYLAPPGYGVKNNAKGDWHRIGVLSLPFPSPDRDSFELSPTQRDKIFSSET